MALSALEYTEEAAEELRLGLARRPPPSLTILDSDYDDEAEAVEFAEYVAPEGGRPGRFLDIRGAHRIEVEKALVEFGFSAGEAGSLAERYTHLKAFPYLNPALLALAERQLRLPVAPTTAAKKIAAASGAPAASKKAFAPLPARTMPQAPRTAPPPVVKAAPTRTVYKPARSAVRPLATPPATSALSLEAAVQLITARKILFLGGRERTPDQITDLANELLTYIDLLRDLQRNEQQVILSPLA